MNAIRAGMKMWSDTTCVRFEEASRERSYANFQNGGGWVILNWPEREKENLEWKLTNEMSFQITYSKSSIPPSPRGLFISNTFEGISKSFKHVWGEANRDGELIRDGGLGGLFNLAKMVISALHKKLECKVEKLSTGSWRSCNRGSKQLWISSNDVLQRWLIYTV